MLKSIQTEPTREPVTLAEAKQNAAIDHDDDDALVSRMITSARKHVEMITNRVLVRQKWRLYLDHGLQAFELQPATVQEVDQIQYVDTDGNTQTLATSVYTVDIPRQAVYLAYNQSWPATRTVRNAAWADVWAGYYKTDSSPIDVLADMPEDIKQAT